MAMTTPLALPLLLVLAVAAAATCAAIDPPSKVPLPELAAKDGADSGRAAGIVAGKLAGELAAKQALSGEKEPSALDCHNLAVANPGVFGFFRKFDTDKTWTLSKREWNLAIRSAVERQMLPADFDGASEWHKVPKDSTDEVRCDTFLHYTKRVKRMSDEQKAAHAERLEAERKERERRAKIIGTVEKSAGTAAPAATAAPAPAPPA